MKKYEIVFQIRKDYWKIIFFVMANKACVLTLYQAGGAVGMLGRGVFSPQFTFIPNNFFFTKPIKLQLFYLESFCKEIFVCHYYHFEIMMPLWRMKVEYMCSIRLRKKMHVIYGLPSVLNIANVINNTSNKGKS